MSNPARKPPRDNGVGYISASREGMYSKCRYQFYDQVVVGGHDQYSEEYEDSMSDAVYLLFGKAVHKTLELFHKNKCNKKSQLIKLFRSSYIDYGVDDKDYYYLGHEMCLTYWNYLKNDAPKRVLVGTEIFFRIVLGKDKYGNDVYAQGTIDAVFYLGHGIYQIVDYKTSSWLPSTDEFEANTQIALYDIAFRSPELSGYWYNGIEPKGILLTMNYLRYEDGVLQTEIDDETRELNRMYFIDTFTQMNTKKKEFFVCKVSTMCPYCDSAERCPRYQEIVNGNEDTIREIVSDFSENDFADNIRSVAMFKGMIKILDSAIADKQSECEEYIKHNDADVIVDGYEYFLANSSRRYMLPVLTKKILEQEGLWDDKVFVPSIPVGKVERLCKSRPDVWNLLESRGAVRRSNGAPTLKSKKVPKGLLFKEKRKK